MEQIRSNCLFERKLKELLIKDVTIDGGIYE
jgi:hypothetical protein